MSWLSQLALSACWSIIGLWHNTSPPPISPQTARTIVFFPPPLLAAENKTLVLPSTSPSCTSSSPSCSSPSSSTWSSSLSRSSYSPTSASPHRRSSVKSASRSSSTISSFSNSEAGQRGGRRRGQRNSDTEEPTRPARASGHHSTTPEGGPAGASRRPVLPTKNGITPVSAKEGNYRKGEKHAVDASRPYEDGRTSSVTEREGNIEERRRQRSHGGYEKQHDYRRSRGIDTDYGRHKHHRPPRERRKGHRSGSHGVNRGDRRYSRRHGSHDEER